MRNKKLPKKRLAKNKAIKKYLREFENEMDQLITPKVLKNWRKCYV